MKFLKNSSKAQSTYIFVSLCHKICVNNCTFKAMGYEKSEEVLLNLQLNFCVLFGKGNASTES